MKLTYLSYLIFPLFTGSAFAAETANMFPDLERYYYTEIASSAKKLVSDARSLRGIKIKPVGNSYERLNETELENNARLANHYLEQVRALDEKIAGCKDLPLGDWERFTTGNPMEELIARNAGHPIILALEQGLYLFAVELLHRGVIKPEIPNDVLKRFMQQAKQMDQANHNEVGTQIIHIFENAQQLDVLPPVEENFYKGVTLVELLQSAVKSFEDIRCGLHNDYDENLKSAEELHRSKREDLAKTYQALTGPHKEKLRKLEEENVVDSYWSSPRKNTNSQINQLATEEVQKQKDLDDELGNTRARLKKSHDDKLMACIRERDLELADVIKSTMDDIMVAAKGETLFSAAPIKTGIELEHPLALLLSGGFVRSAFTLVHYGLVFNSLEQAAPVLQTLHATQGEINALITEGHFDTTKLCLLAWQKHGFGNLKDAKEMVEQVQEANQGLWSRTYSFLSSLTLTNLYSWWSAKPAQQAKVEAVEPQAEQEQLIFVSEQLETNDKAQAIFFGPYLSFVKRL